MDVKTLQKLRKSVKALKMMEIHKATEPFFSKCLRPLYPILDNTVGDKDDNYVNSDLENPTPTGPSYNQPPSGPVSQISLKDERNYDYTPKVAFSDKRNELLETDNSATTDKISEPKSAIIRGNINHTQIFENNQSDHSKMAPENTVLHPSSSVMMPPLNKNLHTKVLNEQS